MLAELVPVERVIAVSAYVDDPALSNAAGKYPPSTPRVRAELERIVSLTPDLVCVNPYNSADFLDFLQKSGRPIFRHHDITSIAGIEQCLRALGERVGAPDKARAIVQDMQARLAAVESALKGVEKRPRVFYWSASWTAGLNTTIHEVIERAGGINAAAETGRSGMYEISAEQMFAVDPDILLLDARDSLATLPGRELPPQLKKLRAFEKGHVVHVAGRSLTAVSQHIVAGVEELARALHPRSFVSLGAAGSPVARPTQK